MGQCGRIDYMVGTVWQDRLYGWDSVARYVDCMVGTVWPDRLYGWVSNSTWLPAILEYIYCG